MMAQVRCANCAEVVFFEVWDGARVKKCPRCGREIRTWN